MSTDARRRANAKYLAKQARINLTLSPFEKDCFQKAATDAGKSLTAYIMDAVNQQITIDQDGQEIPPELISRLIQWLKDNGYSDADVVQFLKYISTTEET